MPRPTFETTKVFFIVVAFAPLIENNPLWRFCFLKLFRLGGRFTPSA